MAMLKQMGGHCFLLGHSNKPLYKEQCISPYDANVVDELMINGMRMEYDFFNNVVQLEEYAFSVKRCNNMNKFLLLSKLDFNKESSIKNKLFGHDFKNEECPDLTKCHLRTISLSQTFNDDFVFVEKSVDIPHDHLHNNNGRTINEQVPPCELMCIRLMMMSFIHKEILSDPMLKIGDSFIHEQIGTHIFFHDRVIERWRREIEFKIVSGSFKIINQKQLQRR